jgi:HEPN domain-containing protein
VYQQDPNVAVWQSAKEYLEAAEILLDYNRIGPAAIVAAFALELCLKSFLAKRLAPWTATTQKGHSLVDLFDAIAPDDRRLVLETSTQLDHSVKFEDSIRKFDRLFEIGRYPHEPNAPNAVGSDVVYFARHVHSVVLAVAKRRNV